MRNEKRYTAIQPLAMHHSFKGVYTRTSDIEGDFSRVVVTLNPTMDGRVVINVFLDW